MQMSFIIIIFMKEYICAHSAHTFTGQPNGVRAHIHVSTTVQDAGNVSSAS